MPTSVERLRTALNGNAEEFGVQVNDEILKSLGHYYELILKWNEHLHLIAPCSPEEFATRHVLESLLLLRHLASSTHLIDVGSGAGLPAIPCLITRSDLRATLIESSQRKTVFLREALRVLGVSGRAQVIASRFEETPALKAESVTSRALDRFKEMLSTLVEWSPPNSTLLLFGGDELRTQVATLLPDLETYRVPGSERRFLLIAKRPER